jgi:endonuclease/exonuclease/phosphatase family metal-dependent hydrolase
MPFYKGVLDGLSREVAGQVAERLLRLRRNLEKDIPHRNVLNSVLIATWNLREFGANRKCGRRLDESILYIAEIITHFDIIAIQEVNANLADLQKLMSLLGDWWEYLVTDVTAGRSGNDERIAFLYDGRKVRFDHLAGEITLPPSKTPARQLARSPFICAFRAGWRRVSLCSVHVYYGEGNPNDPVRVAEIDALSELLAARNEKRQSASDGEPEIVVLLGDFNIFNRAGDETSAALERHDFILPKKLRTLPGSNLAGDKYFDQIAFHDPRKRLRATCAGVYDFTNVIFGEGEAAIYDEAMQRSALEQYKKAGDKEKFYKNWRTFQISDHLPLWLELKSDFADAYLAKVMRGGSLRSSTRPRTVTAAKKKRTRGAG